MPDLLRMASRASLLVAAVAGIVAATGWALGRGDVWPVAVVVASIAAAVGCRAIPALVTYQFTVWVLVTVVVGMLYPDRCLSVGGLDMRNKHLLTAMIQLVMFGMGTQMTLAEFKNVGRMSYPVAIGVLLQFSVMPVVGWGIAKMLGMPPEIAAGMVLIGACSSGLASNVMSYIAEANLPLSLTLTAIGTVTAERPEAHSTGAALPDSTKARLMLWAAARVGAAFSIKPRLPALKGLALVPPSVWMMSAPAATRSTASCSC